MPQTGSQETWSRYLSTGDLRKSMHLLLSTAWGCLSRTKGTNQTGQRLGVPCSQLSRTVRGLMLCCHHLKIIRNFNRRLCISFVTSPQIIWPVVLGEPSFMPIPGHSLAAALQVVSPHQLSCSPDCSFDLRHGLVLRSTQTSRMMVSSTRRDYPNHFLL